MNSSVELLLSIIISFERSLADVYRLMEEQTETIILLLQRIETMEKLLEKEYGDNK